MTEICRNETIKYEARNERCMNDLKKLLNNKPCDNERCDNKEKSTDHTVSDNEPCNNEPIDNEPCINEPIDNEKSTDHKTNKLIDPVNLLAEVRKGFSDKINKICILMSELQDEIHRDDSWLRLVEMNKINALLHESLDYIWKMIYGKNREKNEIKNIDIDKDKDIDGYVTKYTDIAYDKSELVNKIREVLDNIMVDIARGTDNNIIAKNLKKWKDDIPKLISVNVYAKPDTKKHRSESSTFKTKTKIKTKTKDKTKMKIKINNKINLINRINRRLAKLKTKVANKIKSVSKAMRKLQDDSWLRLVELNKIDDILDDVINLVRYEIYVKRKSPEKINIDKHKDIDEYVSKLTVIVNLK